jgi:hypothetical protein
MRLGGEDTHYIARPLGQVLVQFRDQANQIHLQLIALLVKENYAAYHPPAKSGHWGEDYMNYYGDTIEAVGVLGDPRAIAALAGAMETGGNATGPLASFGGAALPAVLAKFRDAPDPLARHAATEVMTGMLSSMNRPLLSASQLMQIEDALRQAAGDPVSFVRQAALAGLGDLGEKRNCGIISGHITPREPPGVREMAAAAARALHCPG